MAPNHETGADRVAKTKVAAVQGLGQETENTVGTRTKNAVEARIGTGITTGTGIDDAVEAETGNAAGAGIVAVRKDIVDLGPSPVRGVGSHPRDQGSGAVVAGSAAVPGIRLHPGRSRRRKPR